MPMPMPMSMPMSMPMPMPMPMHMQGVEHMVIGTSEERPGIRNGNALRSFLMDAFRYALSETLEHAWARAHAERSATPSTSTSGTRRPSTFSFKNPRPAAISSGGFRSRRGTAKTVPTSSAASHEGQGRSVLARAEEQSGRESASAGAPHSPNSTKRRSRRALD